MDPKEVIKKVVGGDNLTEPEIASFMRAVSEEQVTAAQIGAWLAALAIKGETADEISALSRFIHDKAVQIGPFEDALDIHGTGGDGSGSFNVSSTTLFVVAAGGVVIAKHGNRSSSGSSGSADVLETLGVNINLEPTQVEECVRKVGLGFMFAQKFHPKLRPITGPRKEIGIKTIFNKAFPLVSPASVKNHFLGVTDWPLAPLFAEVLKKQGCRRFMLVHGQDPMDEVSISSPTDIYEYFDGQVKEYVVQPEDFGFAKHPLSDVKGGTPRENAEITKQILSNTEQGPKRDIVLLNAAASFVIAGKVSSWPEGRDLADEMITSHKAEQKLQELITTSNSFTA